MTAAAAAIPTTVAHRESDTRRNARIAGLWYLAMAVLTAFGVVITDTRFIVHGDAAATVSRILADEGLYRAGIFASLFGQAVQLYVGVVFFRLFKPVHRDIATTLLALVVTMVPIAFVPMLLRFAPLLLLQEPAFAATVSLAERQSLALLFVELQQHGTIIVGVFWGLWLLPLGVLAYRSGFIPKIFGVLLVANCAAYLVDTALFVLAPDIRRAISGVLTPLMAIGEVPFLLWLLIRGAR